MADPFLFAQWFDDTSSTLTYLIADAATREAVIIDPVDHQIERDLAALRDLGLRLVLTLETHAHADHITAAGELRKRTGAKAAAPFNCGIAPADLHVEEGTEIRVGGERLVAIETPGHTAGSVCYRWRDAVFTGDTLFIGGCGRTDFQGGDAGALYDSITERLFALPDETRVFPGHDYCGQRVSSIGAERRGNPRLANKTREEFIALMAALNLPRPKLIDVAVPANRNLGLPQGG